jgi:hypothetical protein
MKKSPKPPNPEFEKAKKLIQKYIHKNNIVWPREIKIAKKLLSQYPFEFWEQYTPEVEIYSLSAFLTATCKKEVDKQHNLWKLMLPKEEIKLEDKPIFVLEESQTKKTKTLLEFVDRK